MSKEALQAAARQATITVWNRNPSALIRLTACTAGARNARPVGEDSAMAMKRNYRKKRACERSGRDHANWRGVRARNARERKIPFSRQNRFLAVSRPEIRRILAETD